MPDQEELVHVEIFGQTYAVRGGNDPAYVERLAAYVDERMKEVGRSSGAVDTVRIAVLAALNLADECFRLRREVDQAAKSRPGEVSAERIARLARQLGAALGE